MSIATLDDIITKVRRLTGSGNSLQLSDSEIIDYINSFYLYDFPAQFRSLKLKDKLTFNTVRGIDTYSFDTSAYTTVEMPCYCMKREIQLFQDPWSFYGVNFNWQQQQNFATGDGTTGPYTGTCTSTPLIRSVNNDSATVGYPISRVQNILITANSSLGSTQNVTDVGGGTTSSTLRGDGTGTINYETGAISVTFTNVVPSGENIQIQYNPTSLSIPLSILFFQNQFTLRPIPDRGYTIELVAYRLPSQALLGSSDPNIPTLTGTPEILEWWETLAFGAAKKVYEDRLDPDGIMLMDKGLTERYSLNMTRTYAQLGKQSMNSIFRDQLSYNYGSGGFGYGGFGP